MSATQLTRSESDKMIAGVCGGLAEYLNLDPALVRLAFVVLGLASGMGFIIYLILAIITPTQSQVGVKPSAYVEHNIHQLGDSFSHSVQQARNNRSAPMVGAGALILIGLYFLLQNFGLHLNLSLLWPLVIIGLGAWLLVRSRSGKKAE